MTKKGEVEVGNELWSRKLVKTASGIREVRVVNERARCV